MGFVAKAGLLVPYIRVGILICGGGSRVGEVEGEVEGRAASVGGAVPPPNRNTVGDTEGSWLGASAGGVVPPPNRNTVGLLLVPSLGDWDVVGTDARTEGT